MYRIEYFDNYLKFYRYEIVESFIFDQIVNTKNPRDYNQIRIYKCNSKGNNYSGRMLWPYKQINDNIVPGEKYNERN